ncbi:hypothetical protein D3C79_910700 [compost metagenome]
MLVRTAARASPAQLPATRPELSHTLGYWLDIRSDSLLEAQPSAPASMSQALKPCPRHKAQNTALFGVFEMLAVRLLSALAQLAPAAAAGLQQSPAICRIPPVQRL